MKTTRRKFLRRGVAGSAALLGLADAAWFSALPPVAADDAKVAPDVVQLRPDIEPLVHVLEETPREKLLEAIAARIHRGVSYQEVLAALLLAGVRNIQPRPSVGFKFHGVLVVNSAHLASLASPPAERWLPIFWALDYFKATQARDVREGNWTMAPVKEFLVPPADKAHALFVRTMERWDEYGADASVAALARTAGAAETFEIFWRYGMRDFRSIGHKAIFVANSWRTLNTIGWRHAEPVLRSLAYALLNHEGASPAGRDAPADRPWRRNLKIVSQIRVDWRAGKADSGGTDDMLKTLREGSDEEASKKVVEILNRGVAAQSLWDAHFSFAAELLLRQAGIIALHAVTTVNALHTAYVTSANDETRRLVLLQTAAFLPLFREAMKSRGPVGDARIDQLKPAELKLRGEDALEEIFSVASTNRAEAVRKALAYLEVGQRPKELMDAARLLIFVKGDDPHDYKFSSAVLEDYFHVAPPFQNRFLAASLSFLRGSGEPDNKLVERTRSALKGLKTS